MRAHGKVAAAVRASSLPYTIARPSFITGADRDEPRPMERVGAVVTDVTLGLVGGSRYRSTMNTVLATAAVHGPVRSAMSQRPVKQS